MSNWYDQLERDGFTLLTGVFTVAEVHDICCACEAALSEPAAAASLLVRDGGKPHGARNLLKLWPDVSDLARHSRLCEHLLHVLGPTAGIVRGLYFDKPPGDSWALPWHRDTTIAVEAHREFETFVKPTVKAGVPHVEAPRHMLETMITARIHLDPMTEQNGPLRVIPGSHRIHSELGNQPSATIFSDAGDVLLMRPLLLHASGHCDPSYDGHRRIVHLELANHPQLPDGYDWQDYIPLQ